MKRKYLSIPLLSAAILLGALCAPVAGQAAEEPPLPAYVTIVEDLPLYDEPNSKAGASGAVGPQSMAVLAQRTMSGRDWYQVNTWLGPKWISPSIRYEGSVVPQSFDLLLYDEEPLYRSPSDKEETPYRISPQRVHADAVAYLYDQEEGLQDWQYKAVRIDTWQGKRWIVPDRYLSPLAPAEEPLTLDRYTLLFEQVADSPDAGLPGMYLHTYSYLPIRGMLAPGTVQPDTVYRGENSVWYRIGTPDGSAWINPSLHMPASLEREEKDYTLGRVTSFHAYPFDSAPILGALSPQTVRSFERAGDWIHVETWTGDGWLRVQDDLPLEMTDTAGRFLFGVTPNPIRLEPASAPRIALEGTFALVASPYERTDVELRLQLTNESGEKQEITTVVRNVALGQAKPFSIFTASQIRLNGAATTLLGAELRPAEDRSEDVYQSTSRLRGY
ncbi:hypothetical protein J31TS4_23510 [Paenibacillus sp. J31TS4]|uniref:hypothetical protein n=1 Tax=Paenibacillus sp. J31TS4 TaxID=2807195 RepID=UPI001B0FB93A|nr:hypothetical protein [Paenibacillus sp. J31TS4]GIP39071.1 hypothetical protein J31TS4_23510 [Paenibacillus sp. J31TS4]